MAPASKPVRPAPWGFAEARPARRRPLGREVIVETALGIVDAEGLDALSMRRVAQELNTGAASLYAHVSGKEELVELVLDLAVGGLPQPVPDPERWREQLKDFLRQARDRLVAHNDLARAALTSNIPTRPNQLDAAETVLALLHAGGLPDQVAAYGVDLIGLFLVASAHEISQRGQASPEEAEEYLDGIRAYFATLPTDRYPVLTSMLAPMTRSVGDERFDFSLDVILSGLAVQAQGQSRA
jgi:AcrR family transcriptional regulator